MTRADDDRGRGLSRLRDHDVAERRRRLASHLGVELASLEAALARGGLDDEGADRMVENAIGTFALPFGVAPHVLVDGRDRVVPMAVEEPSVIAAAAGAAKRVRAGGGFRTTVDDSLMIAQVQVHDVEDVAAALDRLSAARADLLALGAAALPSLVSRGGGPRSLDARDLGDGMLVVDVTVDCRDAMGANMLNTLAEALGDAVLAQTGGELGLRILSNDGSLRCVKVSAEVPYEALADDPATAAAHARRIRLASEFAERDPRRAVTHNKGVMNGIDAVVVATGNDWRAVEAAAHAYAARSGSYRPLSTWREDDDARILCGELRVPLAVGVVGGALRAHPGARLALSLLEVSTAGELAAIAASIGLASNLAALRALATEGIQRGHMALHKRALLDGPR